jgi:hypothetical protein
MTRNELIQDFVAWLEEIFVEVRVSGNTVECYKGLLTITPLVIDPSLYSFSVVVWGVKESFYHRVVEPRAREIDDCRFGYNRGRFWFAAESCNHLFRDNRSTAYISDRVTYQYIENEPHWVIGVDAGEEGSP